MSNSNVLISTTLVVLMVFSRLANSVPMQLMFENVDVQNEHEISKMGIAVLDDRSSNLKYVLAIQSSSIWSAIKQKTLKITTLPQLGDISEKSLDQLTDQELLTLKKACHDGLKCVAVDQLLVLQTIMEPMVNGKMLVRTAITKITKVISEFTTEYHQDSYEYEEVQESDDELKIHEAVTTIVNDNIELCQVGIDTADDTKKSTNGNASSSDTKPDKNLTVNFGTINNYNINEGTINSVDVRPSDETNNKKWSSLQCTKKDGTPEPIYLITVDPKSADLKLETRHSELQDEDYQNNNVRRKVDNGKHGVICDSAHTSPKTVGPSNMSNHTNAKDVPKTGANDANDLENNNNVFLSNKGDGGHIDCGCNADVDVVGKGLYNEGNSRKGHVTEGTINNGNMKEYNINKGSINQGTINKSDANGGIINVGTVNNGPTNYGTYNTQEDSDSPKIQEYLASIEQMYSEVLNRLNKT